jgi:hypothetical protein
MKVCLHDDSKNDFTWKDLAETLLKTDGSWDEKPYLYNKYPKEVAEPYESDMLDAFWHSVEPSLLKLRIKEVFPNHSLVAKEDFEKLMEYAEYKADLMETGIKYDYNWWLKCQKKYLLEEKE